MRTFSAFVGAVSVAALALPTRAQDAPELRPLEIHGFVSQGAMLSTDNNYLTKSKRGSFEFAEVGINFTKPLTDELRAGLQLFARDLGPLGNYQPRVDFFYLDQQWSPELGLRVGRVKVPFGLYNEISDVDVARVPILLPQATYPTTSRDFFLAHTGLEFHGTLPLAGFLRYELYGGTTQLETQNRPGAPSEVVETETPYLAGGRLMWEPVEGLRIGGSAQLFNLTGTIFIDPEAAAQLPEEAEIPEDFDGFADFELPAILWTASLEWTHEEWLVAAEYGRWDLAIESDVRPLVIPGCKTPTCKNRFISERYYALASYRWSPRIQTSVYYSAQYADIDNRKGRQNYQHDAAATLRIDLNEFWLVKLEGHYLRGTAYLNPVLNDGTPKSELPDRWGLFLVKTTATF